MNWESRTITLGELARLLREERMDGGQPFAEGFNTALECLAHKVGATAGLPGEDWAAFVKDAEGESLANRPSRFPERWFEKGIEELNKQDRDNMPDTP